MIVWTLVIIFALLTSTALTPVITEEFDLYHSYEYSQMYLEDEPYSELVIEYDYQEGAEPSEDAIFELERKVEKYTEKDSIKSVMGNEIPFNDTATRSPYDRNDISELRDSYRSYEREGDTISIYVLYLNGTWAERKGTLGIADRPYTIGIFLGEIYSVTEETNLKREDIEPSVLVHEFGHLLALVGIGYESDHEHPDPRYSNHCDESEGPCVMSGSLEIKEEMDEKPPLEFCQLCEQDIEYIRNKEAPFGIQDLISFSVIILQFSLGMWVSMAIIRSKHKKNKKYKGFSYDYYE